MVNNPKREGFRISGVVLKLDIGRFVFFSDADQQC